MEYHFKRQETDGDKVIFALALDRKAGKERIMIGTETEIIKRLWDDPDAEIYYDKTRPIGSLFIDYRQDDGSDGWIGRGFMPLWNALHANRWKQPRLEQAASDFCKKMYETRYPLSMYAAIRLWDGYLRERQPRDRELASELYKADLIRLIKPLSEYSKDMLIDRSITDKIRQSGNNMKLDVWYPPKTNIEHITAYGSFLPLILYYHARLTDWSLHFRTCKVCGKIFLAKSLKYSICSDKCRKKQNTQTKRDFDARAVDNEYDRLYKKTRPSGGSTISIKWKRPPIALPNSLLLSSPLMRTSSVKPRKENQRSKTVKLTLPYFVIGYYSNPGESYNFYANCFIFSSIKKSKKCKC